MNSRHFENAVRLMLRRARGSEDLESVPVIPELCEALGMPNASDMIRHLVESSFGNSAQDVRCRKLIMECDIDGTTTQEGATKDLGVSRRQFFRLRSQAIRTIAKNVARILDMSDMKPRDDLEQLARVLVTSDPTAATQIFSLLESTAARLDEMRARLDAGMVLSEHLSVEVPESKKATALALIAQSRLVSGEDTASLNSVLREVDAVVSRLGRGYDETTGFELEYLNFLRAQNRSDAISMRASARNLDRIAGEKRQLMPRTIAAAASAALRCNDRTNARRFVSLLRTQATATHDVCHLAIAGLLNAELCFLEGAYRPAERLARAARAALSHHSSHALRVESFIGRIAIITGGVWDPDEELVARCGDSWRRCEFDAIYGRYLFHRRQLERARVCASRALERARRSAYPGLAAHALVTLGALCWIEGDEYGSQVQYKHALDEFATVFDAVLARDLFAVGDMSEREFGILDDVEPLLDVLVSRMQRIVPNLLFAQYSLDSWRRFFRTLLLQRSAGDLEMVRTNDELFATISEHHQAIAEVIVLFAAPLLPPGKADAFAASIRETLRLLVPDAA